MWLDECIWLTPEFLATLEDEEGELLDHLQLLDKLLKHRQHGQYDLVSADNAQIEGANTEKLWIFSTRGQLTFF